MVYVSLNDDQTKVIGIFESPQIEPIPEGYFGEIENDDPRLLEFLSGSEDE